MASSHASPTAGRRPAVASRDVDSAPLSVGQSRVLDALRSHPHDMDVHAIAAKVGRHVNTVRFHLDRLVDAGLVVRTPKPSSRPGRPRFWYAAAPEPARPAASDPDTYRFLAKVLSGLLVAEVPRPAEAAVRAGRTIGRQLVTGDLGPVRGTDAEAALDRLLAALEAVGFVPHLQPTERDGSHRELIISQCPFRELANDHSDIVCSIHLGMMQGVLGAVQAPLTVEQVHPLVSPGVCAARLRTIDPD